MGEDEAREGEGLFGALDVWRGGVVVVMNLPV